jgi:hypothetical protein
VRQKKAPLALLPSGRFHIYDSDDDICKPSSFHHSEELLVPRGSPFCVLTPVGEVGAAATAMGRHSRVLALGDVTSMEPAKKIIMQP